MNKTRLRQTYFRVNPIKNIVGVSEKLAYHISVTRGDTLGVLGPVAVPAHAPVLNDAVFLDCPDSVAGRRRFSWLWRLFGTF